jgi:hypothetical protein
MLSPQKVLSVTPKNYEIRYSNLIKVRYISFEKIEGGSRLFLPTIPELAYEIELFASERKYVFVLDARDIDRCIKLLYQFVPEKIEVKEKEKM